MFRAAGFLDDAACLRIRRGMDAGWAEPAEILDEGVRSQVDVRLASSIEVEDALLSYVEAQLNRQRGIIGEFFGLPLTSREGTSFLRYPSGGFYKPHRDFGRDAAWPDAARRQVAVVVFLNGSRAVDAAGEFSGGTLQLYVDRDPIDIHPRRGLLVAFHADVLHQVTTVHDGTRDTIVDWFY